MPVRGATKCSRATPQPSNSWPKILKRWVQKLGMPFVWGRKGKTLVPISKEKKYLHFKDVDMNLLAKWTAPEGTVDREGNARAKKPEPSATPFALAMPHHGHSSSGPNINQVEMSAAAMSTLRTMMREELALGIRDVEARLTRTMADSFGPFFLKNVANSSPHLSPDLNEHRELNLQIRKRYARELSAFMSSVGCSLHPVGRPSLHLLMNLPTCCRFCLPGR